MAEDLILILLVDRGLGHVLEHVGWVSALAGLERFFYNRMLLIVPVNVVFCSALLLLRLAVVQILSICLPLYKT